MLRDAIVFEIGTAELEAREVNSMLSCWLAMGVSWATGNKKASNQKNKAYMLKTNSYHHLKIEIHKYF